MMFYIDPFNNFYNYNAREYNKAKEYLKKYNNFMNYMNNKR